MIALFALLAVAFAHLPHGAHPSPYPRGFNHDRPERIREAMKNKQKYPGCCTDPAPARDLDELPGAFDWCNVNGKSYCTASWNQHQPKYCGACWVHGTLSSVNDRIKIVKNGEGVDVLLARQAILNCGAKYGFGNGCHGGESAAVFEFMRLLGLPDETCNNYLAEEKGCPESGEGFCQNCMMFGGDVTDYKCWAVDNYVKYHVKEYGYVKGEAAIMSEVLARGPVVCGMVCPDEFVYGYDGGIFHYRGNETDMDHDVEIVGWGEENGVKFWKIRNSWGSYWGENGFFRLVRGQNNLRIEESCAFAIPEIKDEIKMLTHQIEGSMYGVRPVVHGVPPSQVFPESYKQPPHDEKPTENFALPVQAESSTGVIMAGMLVFALAASLFVWVIKGKIQPQRHEYQPL